MNVLLIDIDSLRPDHLGCYGYGRDTSPHMDAIAASGLRCSNCYVSDMPCMPSRTSLFSGRLGFQHGCVSHTGTRATPYSDDPQRAFRPQSAAQAWPQLLRRAGMHTASFSSFADRHGAWHVHAGFAETYDSGGKGMDTADQVVPDVIEWLQRRPAGQAWFAHVNLWDVHVPYRTPQGAFPSFKNSALPDAWITSDLFAAHYAMPGIRSPQDLWFVRPGNDPNQCPQQFADLSDLKTLIDGYDSAIRHVDDHVGMLVQCLKELRCFDDTLIVITADHGECLGELGAYGGHCFSDPCTARVPMILAGPGLDHLAGQDDATLHYQFDIAATIVQLTGGQVPGGWDAKGMANELSTSQFSGRQELVLSQLAQACQRALCWCEGDRDLIYLRSYRKAYHPLPDALLFDRRADPHLQTDLSSRFPDLLAKASRRLDDWIAEQEQRSGRSDPLQTVLAEPVHYWAADAYKERLLSSGREIWVNKLGL